MPGRPPKSCTGITAVTREVRSTRGHQGVTSQSEADCGDWGRGRLHRACGACVVNSKVPQSRPFPVNRRRTCLTREGRLAKSATTTGIQSGLP